MDTRVFCVYNLARGVFVSSKVTVADTASEPLRMLSVLVGSMAQDAEAGLWLTPLYGVPSVPRLFPFDLVYLDKDHRVLESAEVVHGVQFPSYSPEVASALILPLRSMATIKAEQGDRLIVCPQDEMERQLAAVGALTPSAPELPKNGLGAEPPREISEEDRDVRAESGTKTPARETETTLPAQVGNGRHELRTYSNIREPNPAPGSETSTPAAYRLRWEELIEARIARGMGAVENIRRPERVEPAATDSVPLKQLAEATEPSPDGMPVMMPEPPSMAEPQKQFRYDDPDDIFSNWVVSPFSAPTWLEPRLEPLKKLESESAESLSAAAAPEKQTITVQPASSYSDSPPPLSADSLPAPADHPQDTAPAQIVTPQPPQKTAFTVAQYGMWRVSAATAVGAAAATERTQETSSKSASTRLPEANELSRASGAKPEAPGAGQVPSPAASPSFAESVAAQAAVRKDRVQDSAPLVAPGPTSTTAQAAGFDSAVAGAPALNAVRELPEPSVTAKEAISEGRIAPKLANSQSQQRKPAKDSDAEVDKLRTAIPTQTKNGTPAKLSEPNGAAQKTADELTLTVPLPRFLKPEQKEQKGKLKISIQRVTANAKSEAEADSLKSRVQRWLKPVAPASDRRRAHRRYVPGIAAYYYTGGAPKPHELADISMSGFYLVTEDRWMPGTMIQMTLQKPCARGERKQCIAILAKVVRKGSDGVGAEFVMPETLDQSGYAVPPERTTDRFSLARFL